MDFTDPFWWYYREVALAFLIWALFWVWFLWRRRWHFSVRLLFVIVTSFAVMAAIAAWFIRSHFP
jgi:hypothetical protein